MNKIRTHFLLYICLIGGVCQNQLCASGIVDKEDILSEKQKHELDSMCNILEKEYIISTLVFIYRSKEPYQPKHSLTSYQQFYINIDLTDNSTRIFYEPRENEKLESLKKAFLSLSSPPTNTYSYVKNGLSNVIETSFEFKEQIRRLHEKSGRELSRRLKWFVGISVLFIFSFVILFTIKGSRKGNHIENIEFYGFSRMSTAGSIILCIALFIIQAISYSYLFYSFEYVIALIVSIFNLYPLMILSAEILQLIKDRRFFRQYNTNQKHNLSFGARLLLINSQIPTPILLLNSTFINYYYVNI